MYEAKGYSCRGNVVVHLPSLYYNCISKALFFITTASAMPPKLYPMESKTSKLTKKSVVESLLDQPTQLSPIWTLIEVGNPQLLESV